MERTFEQVQQSVSVVPVDYLSRIVLVIIIWIQLIGKIQQQKLINGGKLINHRCRS